MTKYRRPLSRDLSTYWFWYSWFCGLILTVSQSAEESDPSPAPYMNMTMTRDQSFGHLANDKSNKSVDCSLNPTSPASESDESCWLMCTDTRSSERPYRTIYRHLYRAASSKYYNRILPQRQPTGWYELPYYSSFTLKQCINYYNFMANKNSSGLLLGSIYQYFTFSANDCLFYLFLLLKITLFNTDHWKLTCVRRARVDTAGVPLTRHAFINIQEIL